MWLKGARSADSRVDVERSAWLLKGRRQTGCLSNKEEIGALRPTRTWTVTGESGSSDEDEALLLHDHGTVHATSVSCKRFDCPG